MNSMPQNIVIIDNDMLGDALAFPNIEECRKGMLSCGYPDDEVEAIIFHVESAQQVRELDFGALYTSNGTCYVVTEDWMVCPLDCPADEADDDTINTALDRIYGGK